MQGRIQRRYIWISSIVLAAVIVLLLVAVNVSFSGRAERRTADVLSVVMEYGEDPQGAADDLTTDEAAGLAQTSGRTPYATLRLTNYFLADIGNHDAVSLYMDGAVELTDEEALALVEAARISERAQGRVGQFAFRSADIDGSLRYAFADISGTMLQTVQLGTISFGMGAVAIGAIFVYIWGGVLGFIQPLERRTDEGARLMVQAAETIEKQPDLLPASESTAEGLRAAGAVLEDRTLKRTAVPLSIVLTAQCEEAEQEAEQKNGTLETDIQEDIYVRGNLEQLRSLCRLLLMDSARTMREGGTIGADLFSDGRRAGLVVRSGCLPFTKESMPDGENLAAIRLIARDNGGRAAFEAILPDTLCYTVTWTAARHTGR